MAKKRQAEDDSYESRQRKIITRSKSKSITSDAPEITGSSSTSVISPSDSTKITGPKSFSTFTKSLTLTKPSFKANISASTSENDNSLTSSSHNSTPVSSPHNSITNTPASSPHNSIANTSASSSHNSKINTPARAVHNPKNNTPERAVHNPKNNTPERSQSIDLADFDSDTYDNEEPDVTINLNSENQQSENQQSEIQQGAQDEVVIDLDDNVITLGEVADAKVDRLVKGFINTFVKDKNLWDQFKDIVESIPAPIKINPLSTNVVNFQNVIQYIIQSIWSEYVVNSTGANTLIQKSLNNFNSWRNTFNTKLTALVSEMVEQLELTEMPTNSALVKFVDNYVIKSLLEFWMSQLHSSLTNTKAPTKH
ncbi:2911_t:CDS:2 [Rhizophagus irregularis]|nr:2911_t:CDS:2 [Rhizophagus irregularis]